MENKIHPVFRVRAPMGQPSHEAFTLFASSAEKAEESRRAGGLRGVVAYNLDNSIFDFDPDTDKERQMAFSLPYSLQTQDEYSNLASFETVLTDAELQQLVVQRLKYQALVDALLLKQQTTPLSAPEAELLTDYQEVLAAVNLNNNLIGRQCGFIEEIPDLFGYGGTCLHDLNNVPNVSKIRRATFTLPSDHPFHLGLRFAAPGPDQRTTDFRAAWGPFVIKWLGGSRVWLTMYSFKVYGNGSAGNLQTISDLEDRLNFLLDLGRLTDDDMAYIAVQRAAIEAATKTARDLKLKHADPEYKTYYDQIQAAKKLINDRRKEKQRAPGSARAEIEALKKELYQINREINLNEDAENFYGDEGIVRLTVLPQKRGYLTLVLTGRDPVTIKIPEILKLKAYGTLWPDTRLVLKSNGGAFDWHFLFPTVESVGQYVLPNVSVPFVLQDSDDVFFLSDTDTTGPGTSVSLSISESEGFNPAAPQYDFTADLHSDQGKALEPSNKNDIQNAYLPWLYTLRFRIESGLVPDNTAVLWTTEDFGSTKTLNPGHPNPNVDNPIANVRYVADDAGDGRRGVTAVVDILDPWDTIGFPKDGFKDHMCDFLCGIWDGHSVSGVQPYLINGYIKEAVLMNAREVGDSQVANSDSFWRVTVSDLLSLLDEYEMRDEIILDGLTLGAAMKRLFRVRGLPPAMLAGISETGPLGGEVLPVAGPGEKPAIATKRGTRMGTFARELMDKYGVTTDDDLLRLHAPGGVLTLDVGAAGGFAFSGAATYSGSQVIMRPGLERVQDWTRFYNSYAVEGAKDRLTGVKLERSIVIYKSLLDPSSAIYYPTEKRFPFQKRPEIDTAEDLERALEIAVLRNSLPGSLFSFNSWWLYPLLRLGDTGTADGEAMELVRFSMTLRDPTTCALTVRPVVSENPLA